MRSKNVWIKDVAVIIILGIIIRVVASFMIPGYYPTADGIGYIGISEIFLYDVHLPTLISVYRTPLYPVFLSVLTMLGSTAGKEYALTILTQNIIGMSIPLILYFVITKMTTRKIGCIASILYTITIAPYIWERTILTETLALLNSTIQCVLILELVKNPNRICLYIVYFVVAALGFLTRPALLILPIITLPILALIHHSKKISFYVLITLAAYALVPALYIEGNVYFHGYRGIQQVGDLNNLGKILVYNLPIPKNPTSPFFADAIRIYRDKNGFPDAFHFINNIDPQLYGNIPKMNELQKFSRGVITHSIPLYFVKTVQLLPSTLFDRSTLVSMRMAYVPILTHSWMTLWNSTFYLTGILLLFTFISFPIMCFMAFKKKKIPPALLVSGAAIIFQVAFGAAVVYVDHDRLNVVTLPWLLMYWSQMVFTFVKKKA